MTQITNSVRTAGQYVIVGGLTLVLLLNHTFATASAALIVDINGNGTDSETDASIHLTNQNSITQDNSVSMETDVESEANTGGNTIAENVGDAHIITGDITAMSEVANSAGGNVVTEGSCGSCGGEVIIGVEGNGADSTSAVDITLIHNQQLQQNNSGSILNDLFTDLNTGNNTSRGNVGDSHIASGDIESLIKLSNAYGINVAPAGWGGQGFDGNVTVSGNGANAHVNVSVTLEELKEYLQSNEFWIFNDIEEYKNTGGNECIENVGDCKITTGDITAGVEIDNQGGGNAIGGINLPADPDDPSSEEEEKDTVDTIIEKIMDLLIPSVHAAVPSTENGNPLGALQLPMTGFGAMPMVSWKEIALAVYVLILGVYLRKIVQTLQKRSAVAHV